MLAGVQLVAPLEPLPAEREMHNLARAPYRSWRSLRVAAKAVGDPHHRLPPPAEDALPVVEMDYGFLRGNSEPAARPFLAAADKSSGY